MLMVITVKLTSLYDVVVLCY